MKDFFETFLTIIQPHTFPYPAIVVFWFFNILITFFIDRYNHRLLNPRIVCPICKTKIVEHSEFQRQNLQDDYNKSSLQTNSPGFDVPFRPFFEDDI